MINKYRYFIGVIVGSIAGFGYYYFFGCTNGCPLSSNWMIMTGYGLVSGLLIAMPSKKKEKKAE
jgi:hypothetical protein